MPDFVNDDDFFWEDGNYISPNHDPEVRNFASTPDEERHAFYRNPVIETSNASTPPSTPLGQAFEASKVPQAERIAEYTVHEDSYDSERVKVFIVWANDPEKGQKIIKNFAVWCAEQPQRENCPDHPYRVDSINIFDSTGADGKLDTAEKGRFVLFSDWKPLIARLINIWCKDLHEAGVPDIPTIWKGKKTCIGMFRTRRMEPSTKTCPNCGTEFIANSDEIVTRRDNNCLSFGEEDVPYGPGGSC
jgi:hypothetical protein